MGRYVYGDFNYKFAVAEQSSSLGDVLDEMVGGSTENSVERYISRDGDGEIIKMTIFSGQELVDNIKDFIKDFDENKKPDSNNEIQEFWDKYMMQLFLKNVTIESGVSLTFEVEY